MSLKHPAVERPSLVTASGLRKRGWTDSLIRSFAPPVAETRPNPHYVCAAPMKLYPLAEILATESSPEFLAARSAAESRRAGASRAVATKRAATEARVAAMGVGVPLLGRTDLVCRACRHYNDRLRDDQDPASPESAPGFIARICVNYLRHRLTAYERHLDSIRGAVGVREGYVGIKSRVLDAIAVRYEWLAEECLAQKIRAGADAAAR